MIKILMAAALTLISTTTFAQQTDATRQMTTVSRLECSTNAEWDVLDEAFHFQTVAKWTVSDGQLQSATVRFMQDYAGALYVVEQTPTGFCVISRGVPAL